MKGLGPQYLQRINASEPDLRLNMIKTTVNSIYLFIDSKSQHTSISMGCRRWLFLSSCSLDLWPFDPKTLSVCLRAQVYRCDLILVKLAPIVTKT